MNYNELARTYVSQRGAPEKLRSWSSIYLTAAAFLTRAYFGVNSHIQLPNWQDVVAARNFLLVQLGHQNLEVDATIKIKEDNAVKKCSRQFVEHLPDAEIFYMMVKTLDDSVPFEEALANFLIFLEAYADMKGVIINDDGTYTLKLIHEAKKFPESVVLS